MVVRRFLSFFQSSLGLIFLTFVLVVIASETAGLVKNSNGYAFWTVFFTLILFLIIPQFLIRFVWRVKPDSFGWAWPSGKRWLLWTLAGFLLFLPAVFYFAKQKVFQDYYSLGQITPSKFIFLGVFLTAVYYIAEEFLFRGFLFWGLWPKIKYHSFWVVSLVFAFLHLGKPLPETLFSFFASLFFCYFAFKSKSFLPAAILHFLIALALNILVLGVGVGSGNGLRF